MERIRLESVSKKFGENSIFKNLNFSCHAGDIIGLTGNNGVGKTTLIKILCGLVRPNSGNIFINGNHASSNRNMWMQNVGVLLEGSRSIYWRLSAIQNINYFSGLKGVFGKLADSQAKKMLQFFGLWEIRNQKVENFSFGMKQRLALACSVVHSPSVIILDEPTSGLDAQSTELLEKYIHLLSQEKKSIILASHDLEMVSKISTKKFKIENCVLNEIF